MLQGQDLGAEIGLANLVKSVPGDQVKRGWGVFKLHQVRGIFVAILIEIVNRAVAFVSALERKIPMLKKILCCLAVAVISSQAIAQTRPTITVVIGAAANQSNVPLMLKILDTANQIQDQYLLRPEFKPGGQGVVAVKYMDQEPQTRIASLANSFIENVKAGHLVEKDYVPVNALGDACWAVITNIGDTKRGIASLQDVRGQEITVGGTGFGNAAHLTSLMLAERYGFRVKYVVYKSNYDALINMVSDNTINFVLERVVNYQQLREKNPRLQILGMNCPQRSPAMPEVRTLREQGIGATPMVFNVFAANRSMDAARRADIGRILDRAQAQVGRDAMLSMADVLAPQFDNIGAEEYFKNRMDMMRTLTTRYQTQIDQSK